MCGPICPPTQKNFGAPHLGTPNHPLTFFTSLSPLFFWWVLSGAAGALNPPPLVFFALGGLGPGGISSVGGEKRRRGEVDGDRGVPGFPGKYGPRSSGPTPGVTPAVVPFFGDGEEGDPGWGPRFCFGGPPLIHFFCVVAGCLICAYAVRQFVLV